MSVWGTIWRVLVILLLMFFLVVWSAQAATITLAWDPKPAEQVWDKVVAYEKVGSTYTKLGEVAGAVTQIVIPNVTPGIHTYVVRSVNTPWGESVDSNAVTTADAAKAPVNLKVTIAIVVGP